MFEILEHPADIGFRVTGHTLRELFANAAFALLSISCEIEDVAPREPYKLSAAGTDYESLLVNWLNDILYWFDGRRIAFREFRVTGLTPSGILAEGLGEPRDPARHRARLIVKAVTWHQLKIAGADGNWTAEVFLDI